MLRCSQKHLRTVPPLSVLPLTPWQSLTINFMKGGKMTRCRAQTTAHKHKGLQSLSSWPDHAKGRKAMLLHKHFGKTFSACSPASSKEDEGVLPQKLQPLRKLRQSDMIFPMLFLRARPKSLVACNAPGALGVCEMLCCAVAFPG